MPAEQRFHATAVKLGDYGLLILGPSGSGKSSLALDLLFLADAAGWSTALIGDDVIVIERQGADLVARGHSLVANQIEVRGAGIARVANIARVASTPAHRLSHAVQLDGRFQRLPDPPEFTEFFCLGVALPLGHVSDPRRVASALLLWLQDQLELMKQ
jgi:serine kinase of HPr protein (carbohydrate metabolism regulator)